jgi:hypothetical protein
LEFGVWRRRREVKDELEATRRDNSWSQPIPIRLGNEFYWVGRFVKEQK